MRGFGLELRRTGNTKNLYDDVDKVLAAAGIQDGGVSKNLQHATIAHSLHKMLQSDNYFSVYTIDKCMAICQICIPKERMLIYNSIHCMHWNEMTPDYRHMIMAMVLDDFRNILNP